MQREKFEFDPSSVYFVTKQIIFVIFQKKQPAKN